MQQFVLSASKQWIGELARSARSKTVAEENFPGSTFVLRPKYSGLSLFMPGTGQKENKGALSNAVLTISQAKIICDRSPAGLLTNTFSQFRLAALSSSRDT